MSSRFNTFRNVRIRVHRVAHGRWIAGWVSHLARDGARIHLSAYVGFEIGERVVGECYGDGTVARFQGEVVAQAGQDVAIRTLGSLTYRPSEETVRFEAGGLIGRLREESGKTSEVMVLDVSPLSLGGLAIPCFEPSVPLTLSLPLDSGEIRTSVQVANCRANDVEATHHRLGLHLLSMGRLDSARWTRFLEDRADSSLVAGRR